MVVKVVEIEEAGEKIGTSNLPLSAKLKLLVSTNLLISLCIWVLVTGYFIGATVYYVNHSGGGIDVFNNTTCSGYGLLTILYCFYIYGLLHSYLLKPVIYPLIYKIIWVPIANLLSSIRYGSLIFYISVLIALTAYLVFDTTDNRNRLIPISGLLVFLIIGFLLSSNKRAIPWRTVAWGLILQFIFGLLTIRWEVGRNVLECFGDKVNIFLEYAFQGSAFTYGNVLINEQGVFAFKALSTIYFISFFVNILYYYGIMQKVVGAIGNFLQWVMGTSICESVNSAANIFLGQSEAPLLLGPYLQRLTDSEIHSIMTSGFATVSGSVMAAYIGYGARPQDLITSSIMSAPAALCFSKMIYPETEEIQVHRNNVNTVEIEYKSVLDAASKGAISAIQLILGIVASLIAFLAFVYWIDGILGWLGMLVGFSDPVWSLDLIVGKIFLPISYLMGVPWEECEYVGTLVGIKTMVNEFVAFEKMHQMIEAQQLSVRTKVIATYAICGFSNPGSIGIMISAMGGLIPDKHETITRLVFRAFIGGAMVCFMTACIAGTLMPENAL